MTLRVVSLGFDAIDPPALARFWAEALRWTIDERSDHGVALVPPAETPFAIRFRPVTNEKVGQNRNHLDLTTTSVDDQQETVRRLLELGGRHVDIGQGPDEEHVVLADPEGNELCIIEPTNTFLAGTGRLGAVNCDGSKATGHFWSAALGWPLVWDQDEETAIRAPGGTGPLITWSGPPLMPKHGKNRLHLDLAPTADSTHQAEVDRLLTLGATRLDDGEGDKGSTVMADPDGNELRIIDG